MFETELSPVILALGEAFGNVKNLFEDVNMPEYRNSVLCFCGVSGYTLGEISAASDGKSGRSCEAVFLCEIWSSRVYGAKKLAETVDEKVIPALGLCTGEVKSIKRLPTRYSKETGGYIAAAELVFDAFLPSDVPAQSVGVNICGADFTGFYGYEISSSVKTSETPLIDGIIKSRKVGERPTGIKLFGKFYSGGGSVYSGLKLLLGTKCEPLTVAGIGFDGMMMNGLDLKGNKDGSTDLTVSFTEVDDL